MSNLKVIKSVSKKQFEVALSENLDSGMYFITYTSGQEKAQTQSEDVRDYHMASFLFESKVSDLEGN